MLKLLRDGDDPRSEINILPFQAENFAKAQPGEQIHDEQIFVSVTVNCVQKRNGGILVQWLELLSHNLW